MYCRPIYIHQEEKLTSIPILLGFVIIFVVVWYGAIREEPRLLLAQYSERLVGEFSMFDALVPCA